VIQDVPDILKSILKQYALSVMSESISRPESVAHIVEFMTMSDVKVKKLKQN
jgi:hypothetical protein